MSSLLSSRARMHSLDCKHHPCPCGRLGLSILTCHPTWPSRHEKMVQFRKTSYRLPFRAQRAELRTHRFCQAAWKDVLSGCLPRAQRFRRSISMAYADTLLMSCHRLAYKSPLEVQVRAQQAPFALSTHHQT